MWGLNEGWKAPKGLKTGSKSEGCGRTAKPLASSARHPFDFSLDDPLHQAWQVVVEPGFQHRSQHFLDQVFQRPRVVAEHGVGKRMERGFDRGNRGMRQDLLGRHL